MDILTHEFIIQEQHGDFDCHDCWGCDSRLVAAFLELGRGLLLDVGLEEAELEG